ncbi:MAG: phage portal protein [Bacillota bacterium]|nr:phage portal protein [Bacillota bacterium]
MIEIVLAEKHVLSEVERGVTIEESLDEIAMRVTFQPTVIPGFPAVDPGQPVRVLSSTPKGSGLETVFDGLVWDCESRLVGIKTLTVVGYDRTIYLARSEDEYLLSAGQTASARLKRYASDWRIPVGAVADTRILLAQAVYRAQEIYSMISSDLAETAYKGGGLFRARMSGRQLELVELGANKVVWIFAVGENIEELGQRRTLEGTVTQVKVLGSQMIESGLAELLAVEKGETGKFGTLQKVIQDSKLTSVAEARTRAKAVLCGIQETFTVTAPCIPTIRAGDQVRLGELSLIVIGVKHELGTPGQSTLELADRDFVRRRFYAWTPSSTSPEPWMLGL